MERKRQWLDEFAQRLDAEIQRLVDDQGIEKDVAEQMICNSWSRQWAADDITHSAAELKSEGSFMQQERLADLIHQQWMSWAASIMGSERLSTARVERWTQYMIPYAELDEQTKEEDRRWARRFMAVLYTNIYGQIASELGVDEKTLLRRLDGRIEWMCEHRVGHTVWCPEGRDIEHGCDGCCKIFKEW